jgi:formate--tetrahydrofolate ligase
VETVACTHWQDGGAGAEDLANKVVDMMAQDVNSDFNFLYEEGLTLWEKIETIADKAYGAGSVIAANTVSRRLDQLQEFGHGNLPICMAKTPMSFSSDPNKLGAPDGHELQIREVRLAAGAGFVVAVCGSMMTMPGLPRRPAAADISVDDEGNIDGLF